MRKIKERTFTGVRTTEERDYEIRHRELARKAAAEGFVLLKNDGQTLPVATDKKIALYGAGAVKTVKGGTGSGDVNERHTVSIYEGMKNAGYTITTEDWVADFENVYKAVREAWRDEIWTKCPSDKILEFFDVYSTTPFQIPAGKMPEKTDTDTAVFVLGRVAGEGADRFAKKGDYYLSDEEEAILKKITELYEHVAVLLNIGGIVDCSFLDKYEIDAVMLLSQPGMEAGNAVADVLSGKVTPGGKLTDSFAYNYEDYPNAATFSHNKGSVDKEVYYDGIYVGYRYFDTWQMPVRFGFGYGLSYTEFDTEVTKISREDDRAEHGTPSFAVEVKVTNKGVKYSGREVVQAYISCPQSETEKEYRRLVGFAKTGLLLPGESETVKITWSVSDMASFDEKDAAWKLEKGIYGVYLGNSLMSSAPVAGIELDETCVLVKTKNICPVKEQFEEIKPSQEKVSERRAHMEEDVKRLPMIVLPASDITTEIIDYDRGDFLEESPEMDFVNSLSEDQLVQLVTGDPGRSQGSTIGSAGISVPGSAAETSHCAMEEGLVGIVMADGPAGLRLTQNYYVENGQIVPMTFDRSIENGYLYRGEKEVSGDKYYQYCTAIPVGTLLAQSWDIELVKEVGAAIGEEMDIFNVMLWLAPGMCIHRNPLCGRNFEYYSEDPLVSGKIAAAMTDGVQSVPGCGTTIKHFCCNNQEDNRMDSDSILSERALREIYMRGFEIAVKESAPLSIMTSYNKINGIHAANNYDICINVARKEWGYDGVFMTDWTTTHDRPACTASGCMRAGNDLVMPGIPADHENMKKELKEGTLRIEEIKRSVSHLVHVAWQSEQYE